jgi:hypothetical protein
MTSILVPLPAATEPTAATPTPAKRSSTAAAAVIGVVCVVCGLEPVVPPRVRYCSVRCRRRAAFLRQRRQRRPRPEPQTARTHDSPQLDHEQEDAA